MASPSHNPDRPDHAFVALIASGDRDAAAALVHDRYAAPLARAVASLALSLGGADEADAIANWAVCRAVVKGADFDPNRGSLERWVHTIARSRALSLLRRVKVLREVGESRADRTQEVERVYQRHETLRRVLERMSSVHRRVLLVDLAHDGQATAVVAGEELGMTPEAVYKNRCQARKVFRELWLLETGGEGRS